MKTREELDNKAEKFYQDLFNNPYRADIGGIDIKQYGKKLAIDFTISVLSSMESDILSDLEICKFENKIKELKQCLNEN